ncbi:DUF2497 domain-containing protein [Xanthobacteraceae bacterium A53D]
MDEILASIRRIIADDDHEPQRRPAPQRPEAQRSEAHRADVQPSEAHRLDAPRPEMRGEPARRPAPPVAAAPSRERQMERAPVLEATRPDPRSLRPETPRVATVPVAAPAPRAEGFRRELADVPPRAAPRPAPVPEALHAPAADRWSDVSGLSDSELEAGIEEALAFVDTAPRHAPEPQPVAQPQPVIHAQPVAQPRPAAQPAPRPVAVEPPVRELPEVRQTRVEMPQPRRKDLLSPSVDAAVSAAFGSLGSTALPEQGRTVEDLMKEILRPMLKDWLDDHLPDIVERLVRAEIERISRTGR